MTQAQKTAKAKFKQAIAYRQKTGVSLKEAFAHIYGKKKVSKKVAKKIVRKKVAKKIGALPIGFKGSIWDIKFKVVNQFDIYGDVSAIVENIDTGYRIVTFDGKGSANEKAEIFAGYVARHKTEENTSDTDIKALKSRLLKFVTNMQKEVKDYNAGKKKTIKKQPLNIPIPKVKKIARKKLVAKNIVKKQHTHWGTVHSHQRRVNGVKKKKITETGILNRIHKVKKDVERLDKAQHKHMIGALSKHNIDKIKDELQNVKKLETHLMILKINLPKIVKSQLPMIRREIKKTREAIKEHKTHIVQLKKHI
jgi:hypothetical protein